MPKLFHNRQQKFGKRYPPLSKIIKPSPLTRELPSPVKNPADTPKPQDSPVYNVPDTPNPKLPETPKQHYPNPGGYFPNRQPMLPMPSFDPKGKQPLKIGPEHKLEGTYRHLYYKQGVERGSRWCTYCNKKFTRPSNRHRHEREFCHAKPADAEPTKEEEEKKKKKTSDQLPDVILMDPVFQL